MFMKLIGVYHVYSKFLPSNTYHTIKTWKLKEPIINLAWTNSFTDEKYSKKGCSFFVTKRLTTFFVKAQNFMQFPPHDFTKFSQLVMHTLMKELHNDILVF